jgi:hypothetical protein
MMVMKRGLSKGGIEKDFGAIAVEIVRGSFRQTYKNVLDYM